MAKFHTVALEKDPVQLGGLFCRLKAGFVDFSLLGRKILLRMRRHCRVARWYIFKKRFSNQRAHFGHILEGLRMETVVYFMAIR
jgi:hypothetical protein